MKELLDNLKRIGQQQVLAYADTLDEAGAGKLKLQLEALDLEGISELAEKQVRLNAPLPLPAEILPITPYPHAAADDRQRQLYAQAEKRGLELLASGKVGAFLVAGGQGTRLGYDGPKGEYPVTPLLNKPLFQTFAEQLLAHSKMAGRSIPWYIMTSDINDAATRDFFQTHDFFGYQRDDVLFLKQGMMPAFSMDGKMLLAAKDSLALSPDGHGGSLRAIAKSGALADMLQRGVEHLSYFQVDNPLVHCIDPLFIGLHDLSDCEMASKTIAKSGPLEKVGNFCLADGKLQVIEYSDLPNELAERRNRDGQLTFNAGSIAIHILRVSFVKRLNEGGRLNLPWHRAEKKVPALDERGNLVKPEKPNAVKLEQFVFDAIMLARNPIVYTTVRQEEFSPVKNAEGNDSPATCRRDQLARHVRWLKEAGAQVAEDAVVEISPLYAATSGQLRQRSQTPKSVAGKMYFDADGPHPM